jgi:hypothetical protein
MPPPSLLTQHFVLAGLEGGGGEGFTWPSRSPELRPLVFFLWGHLKRFIYETPMETQEGLVTTWPRDQNRVLRLEAQQHVWHCSGHARSLWKCAPEHDTPLQWLQRSRWLALRIELFELIWNNINSFTHSKQQINICENETKSFKHGIHIRNHSSRVAYFCNRRINAL